MNKSIRCILTALLLTLNFSCLDDDSTTGSSGSKGTLNVTVNTSADIWGYPLASGTIFLAFSGDTTGFWCYPAVGGDGNPSDEDSLYNTLITSSTEDLGDRINAVYIYSTLGDSSSSTPVLYKGESADNNGIITIGDIEPGAYCIVAFYDYSGGGNRENLLNRYDRYAIYTAESPEDSTANSTPFQDRASTVTITGGQTTSVTLDINKNWVLGKPKTSSGGTGRIFLKSTDPVPVP